jgi:hypothetical protein
MSSESDAKNPLRAFTQSGRVLVVVSMIFGGVVFYVSIDREFFLPGFYPLIVLLLPGLGGALALFCLGCIVYRLLGIRVWATPAVESGAPTEEARHPDTHRSTDASNE